jgi:hypothetical protein
MTVIIAHLTETDLPDLILFVGVGFVSGYSTAVAALRARRRN